MSGNGDETNANESELDVEIENWCLTRPAVEMDAILAELEMLQRGTRFDRAHRLFRRLRGDYTAADFARTDAGEGVEEDESIRRIQVETLIDTTELSSNARNLIRARQQRRTAIISSIESIPENQGIHHPLANSTNNQVPTTSGNDIVVSAAPTASTANSSIDVATSGVTPPAVASTSRQANAENTAGNATISTTSVQGGILSTREGETNHTLLCRLADGQLYEVRREVALEMARLKDAVHNIEIIANAQKSDTPEINGLQQAMQIGNAASSTRLPTPQNQTNTSEIARRNVAFQDTFDVRYINAGGNTTTQADATAGAPSTPAPTATTPGYGEPGGGGDSQSQQTYVAASSQRPPDLSATALLNKQRDIGRTVRAWKVKFDGEKSSSIEEFIQRVDECRTLAHIPDDDLLNAMTELMSGVALFWCRQSEAHWHTWADFCASARRCYGLDSKFQQRLVVEAQTRTQGRDEPARDYIFCLLTLLSRMERPWDVGEQLDLLHKNMLPSLKQLVKRHKFTSVDELIELAREAEDLIAADNNYRPPPKPEETLLPECAYKVKSDKAPKAPKPSISAIAGPPPTDWAAMIQQAVAQALKAQAKSLASEKPKAAPAPDSSGKKEEGDATSAPVKPKEGKKKKKTGKGQRTPASEKNKNREQGPLSFVVCWGCSWPGYIRATCPECSLKEQGGE